MAWRTTQQSEQARNYYANYNEIKARIFECADKFKDTYATYYNIKINRKQDSPKRLNDVRTALIRLCSEIRPKLQEFGNEKVKKCIEEINEYELSMDRIPFRKIVEFKNIIIDWIEQSGLSKIDIEKQNILDQVESECYE